MTTVSVTKSINVSSEKAWDQLSSFRGIENYSPIERSVTNGNGEGATRTCYMPDGAAIDEVLSMVNNDTKQFQYKITEGPFPVTGYLSTVSVKSLSDNSCEITWAADFETAQENEAAMKELFGGFYNVIIESLESYINN